MTSIRTKNQTCNCRGKKWLGRRLLRLKARRLAD